MPSGFVKVANKDINVPLLFEEVVAAALPGVSMTFHGFLGGTAANNTKQPDPAASGPVQLDFDVDGTRPGPTVTNEPGLLVFVTENALSVPENNTLDSVLTAHDATILTTEQQRKSQDAADFTAARTQWNNIGTMDDTQLRQYVALIARLLLRRIGPQGTRDID